MLLIKNKLVGGILLVSGTTVGAAMLALPSVTGLAGFYPSILLFFFYWLFFAFTALLMLEVTLWMETNANLTTMARRTLGLWGETLSWTVYLFLLYSLTVAYLSGSSQIFNDFVDAVAGYDFPNWTGPIPLLLVFGFFVYRGTLYVDIANRVLMLGLAITFATTVFYLAPHVDTQLLTHSNWKYVLISNSVIATSFGFHIIIPSMAAYMERDVKMLRRAILIGSAIPFIVYVIWEWLALGVIPMEGKYSIINGYTTGANGAYLITGILGNTWLAMILRFFAFFAIITSFLGVSLSLQDFLADGFKIKKTPFGKIKLYMMTFLPALFFLWTNPRAFLTALEYAGAFGVMILLGFLPALMVWRGRYHQELPATLFRTPGGKPALIFVMAVSSAVVLLEVFNKLGITDMLINIKG
jgi:tyrosine-specific transport protein